MKFAILKNWIVKIQVLFCILLVQQENQNELFIQQPDMLFGQNLQQNGFLIYKKMIFFSQLQILVGLQGILTLFMDHF